MGQPLFLHSVMQEKIWGRNSSERRSLVTKFRATMSVNFGRFQPIHGVSKVANGPNEGMGLDPALSKASGNYSVIVKSLSFLY